MNDLEQDKLQAFFSQQIKNLLKEFHINHKEFILESLNSSDRFYKIDFDDSNKSTFKIVIHLFGDGLDLEKKAFLEESILKDLKKANFNYLNAIKDKFILNILINFTSIHKKINKNTSQDILYPTRDNNTDTNNSNINTANIDSNFTELSDTNSILGDIKNIFCVASAKGGVGKSSISANLALSLKSSGYSVGLLDADIQGPSLVKMFNIKDDIKIDANQKLIPMDVMGLKCVSFAMLSSKNHALIWRGPLISKAISQLLFDVAWPDLDYLIIDLPPGTADVTITIVDSIALDGVIIASTVSPIALIDAQKAVSMFKMKDIYIYGVIANMVSLNCSNCGSVNYPFGSMKNLEYFCQSNDLKLMSCLPLVKHSTSESDHKKPHTYSDLAFLYDEHYKNAILSAHKYLID